MHTRTLFIPVGLVACLVCVAIAQKPEPDKKPDEQDKNRTPLQTFMHQKLDSSSKILEGLCQEDASLIKEGASEMAELSKAELWNVLTDPDYREYSREFRDNTVRLSKAADEGDFDKAALRWFDVTIACMDCHEHVRADRKAEKK